MDHLGAVRQQPSRDPDILHLAVLPVQPAIEDPAAAHEPCAIVMEKIGRPGDRRVHCEVPGRCDGHAPAAQQGSRDEASVAWLIEKDANVDLIFENVDVGIVQHQLDADARIARRELRNQRRDAVPADFERRADPHMSLRIPRAGHDLGLGGVEVAQNGLGALQQETALFHQREAARTALDQPHAEARLQGGEAPAHGGQRALHASRRFREASGGDDTHEQAQVVEIVRHQHPSVFRKDACKFLRLQGRARAAT